MKRHLYLISIAICISISIKAQEADSIVVTSTEITKSEKPEHLYKIKPWIDIPATVVFAAWSFYGMSVIYGRDLVPESELLQLNKNDINSFDRPIASNYSTKSKSASDMFFYGSMPLPLFLLLDKKIRKDGPRIGLLFLETMGTTGVIYTISAMSANRFRPYSYNTDVPLNIRQRGGARNSFFAGHPAVVASSTFFMAQVYTHYHPNMKCKWIPYFLAGAATATTGLLRLQAGQHFRTDVITGVVVGTLVGNLVPHFHIDKSFNSSKLALLPNFQNDAAGFTAYYRLGK